MTISGSAYSVPGGTNLAGKLDRSRLLLRIGDELAIFDLARGALTTKRAVAGLRYASPHGGWIHVESNDGPSLVRADLTGDEVRWPDPERFRLAGVVGSIAIVSDYNERARFDLDRKELLDRAPNEAVWYSVHDELGLLLGVRERTREIIALRGADGTVAWTARPFTVKVDSVGHPRGHGGEVHVRASTAGDALVARLDGRDGSLKSVRPAPPSLDSWLPDLGDDVDRQGARYARRRSTYAEGDALVVPQDTQLVVVRANGVARVAIPEVSGAVFIGGVYAGIAADRTHISLVVVPLPAEGEHDLELVPKGDEAGAPAAAEGVPGVVTFAGTSAPIVIVQHPQYGRINLTRLPGGAPPPVGAQVILDGVEVKPGGVVRVERWWLAGARPQRETVRLPLGPPAMDRSDEKSADEEPTTLARSLVARAEEEGIAVPADVLRFVEVVDRDPRFRRALSDLGFHFEEEELGLDILPELEIEGFVSLWGNGYGDGYGGLTKDGLGYLHVKDDREPVPIGPLVDHVLEGATESNMEATAAVVLEVLDREGLSAPRP